VLSESRIPRPGAHLFECMKLMTAPSSSGLNSDQSGKDFFSQHLSIHSLSGANVSEAIWLWPAVLSLLGKLKGRD
jgi:hypothetical protein